MKDIKDAYMAGCLKGVQCCQSVVAPETLNEWWAEYETQFHTDPPIRLSLDEIWNCTKSISGFKKVSDIHHYTNEEIAEYVLMKKKGQHL